MNRAGAFPISAISPKFHPMPITPPRSAAVATLAQMRARGIAPEDVNADWLDDMTKRLFAELKRQLAQVENAPIAPGAAERAANARTLASLERTLERLAKLEQQRVLQRETKVAAKHDQALAALERRIDRLVAAGSAAADSAESEG